MRQLLERLLSHYRCYYTRRIDEKKAKSEWEKPTAKYLDIQLIWMIVKVTVLVPCICTIPISIITFTIFSILPPDTDPLLEAAIYLLVIIICCIIVTIEIFKSVAKYDALKAS